MPGLGRFPRDLRGEWMDDPSLPVEAHRRALRGLARLNACSRSGAPIWRAMEPYVRNGDGRASVLDVASGSGDVLIDVARRARRSGVDLDLCAADISPVASRALEERSARSGIPVRTVTTDVVAGELPGRFDIVMCSLFLHHLSMDDIVRLLRKMAGAARKMVVISDLVRSRVALAIAFGASRVLTRSRVVHVDAVRSVRAALTPRELADAARAAGLQGFSIRKAFAVRMVLTWQPPAAGLT